MAQTQPSYHSFRSTEATEVSALNPGRKAHAAESRSPRNPGRSVVRRGVAVLLGVAVVAGIWSPHALVTIPTAREAALAESLEVPLWGNVRKIRDAQNLADHYQKSLLLQSGQMKHVLKKIEKKGSIDDYAKPPEGCEATVVIVRRKSLRATSASHASDYNPAVSTYIPTPVFLVGSSITHTVRLSVY
jgi:hypothetical protein